MEDVKIWVRFSRSIPAWRLPTSSWLQATSLVVQTPIGLFAVITTTWPASSGGRQVADQFRGHGVQPVRPVQGDDPHPRCELVDPDGAAGSRIRRSAIGRHQSWIAAVRRSDMPSSVCLPPIRPQPVRRPPAPPNGMLMSHQQVLSFTTTWPTSSSSTNR
jgi:hypothetical protein